MDRILKPLAVAATAITVASAARGGVQLYRAWRGSARSPVVVPGQGKADFLIAPDGTAIPTNPRRLRNALNHLDDVSTNPATSRKFIGTDSNGPLRVRVERGHIENPSYTGLRDPLHAVDHLHIDRRIRGETGPWRSNNKVPYDWPFDD